MSLTNPTTLKAIERECRAIQLRKEGKTYEEIGRILNIHYTNAYRIVKQGIDRLMNATREDVEYIRHLENRRLDAMYNAISAKIEAGDLEAIRTGLAIMARRAKQFGTDAPEQVQNTFLFESKSDAELFAEAKRLGIKVDETPALPAPIQEEEIIDVVPEVKDEVV